MPIASKDHLDRINSVREQLDREAMSVDVINKIISAIDKEIQINKDYRVVATIKDELGKSIDKSASLQEYLKHLYKAYGWEVDFGVYGYDSVFVYLTPTKKSFFQRLFSR